MGLAWYHPTPQTTGCWRKTAEATRDLTGQRNPPQPAPDAQGAEEPTFSASWRFVVRGQACRISDGLRRDRLPSRKISDFRCSLNSGIGRKTAVGIDDSLVKHMHVPGRAFSSISWCRHDNAVLHVLTVSGFRFRTTKTELFHCSTEDESVFDTVDRSNSMVDSN